MSIRELVVLGTASQVPTRTRNHNGYLLRWDGEGILFDPGEGTQRQMLLAGVPASDITRICITHFHGDHSLGVPGIVQRLSLDRVAHPVRAHFPKSGQHFFGRMHHATSFYDAVDIRQEPVEHEGPIAGSLLEARRLDHSLDTFGYRLVEPDGRRIVPELLARHGIKGPMVRELQKRGQLGAVRLEDVSVARPGQRFAFVMDTRLCEGVFALADQADLLVIESTYLAQDEELAVSHGHLTARQAALVAKECGVRKLVLTHFSQRYSDPSAFHAEAAEVFDGEIIVAADLDRIAVPKRATP